ncbi:MAG: nuclear transport factor 2 family protein [Kofleriaceae bacterium]|nr:nuclear transport factor 2 family protein [Kofleriaceae bacterium]MCL4227866.1 nuclear transport factor 2 family protein [Myxococcales bacterium]
MRRRHLAAVVLCGLVACGGGGAGATRPADPAAADAFSAVFRAVEQWRQGWEVRSLDALAPLYRQDGNTVVVHQGRAHVGWPQAQIYLRQAVDGARAVHLTIENGQVTALGPGGAHFSARLVREISDGAVTVTDEGFLTLTFARSASGERWEIVSEHYSYPPVP